MAHLSFRLFGAPRLQCDGAPVRIVRRRAIACAVYLAVTGREVSRETLAAVFWPESDAGHARADLRRTLHLLHQAFGPERLVTEQEHVRLRRGADLWLDVEHFRHLLAACQTHGHAAEEVCGDCLPLLAAAAVLYRDDFLAGFTLPDSPDFDQWQSLEGEALRSELASAFARLVRGHVAQGEFSHAIAYARRWVALDPLDEPAQRWLMQLYAWSGERSAALQQYQSCAQLLAQELDVAPEPATRQVEQAIRAGRLPPPPGAEVLGVVQSSGQRATHAAPAPDDAGELRIVTVLSAGLHPGQRTDDESAAAVDELVAQSDRLLAIARAACEPYGGRVQRMPAGDVLALFGLDRIHEDDAERAIRAGLAIRQAARAEVLAVQIGINTGMACCTHPGPAAQAEALLMGSMVSLAARLRDCAVSDQILVGRTAYRPARGVFDYVALDLALPGQAGRVTAYEVLRLRDHAVKVRGIEGLRAALTGRATEMAQLTAACRNVLAGQGQVVLISGAAGIGKSRLVAELREEWTAGDDAGTGPDAGLLAPRVWLEGRCLELATGASYGPFVDMLRHSLDRGTAGDDAALASSLRKTLSALAARGDLPAEQVEEAGPLLARLLSLRCGDDWDERGRQIDPRQVRPRTCAAVQTLVTALARRGPVALVLEDLHWADALSLDLIGDLMAVLADAPLLLVCVYRPELAQAGEPLLALAARQCQQRCTALHLDELSPGHSRELLASLLVIEQLPEQTRSLILAKAQGNPFFLEEIVRGQIDSGLLYRHADSWRSRAEIATVTLPETVQSVILSRADRLPAEQRQLLQMAAVLGRYFPRRLLAAVAPSGLDLAAALDAALEALAALALVYQERSVPEVEYSFRHVLVQDAIYQAVPARRRAVLHRQVAEALEALAAGNPGPHIEQLAYHYDRSDAAEKAIEYLVRAGEKAQNAYFNDEAVSYYQRALARLDALAPSGWQEASVWRLAALKGRGVVHFNLGQETDAEAHFRQALVLAHQIGAAAAVLAPLYGWLCRALRWQNRLDELIAVGLEGLAQSGGEAASQEAAIIYGNLADAYFMKGQSVQYYAVVQRIESVTATLPYSDDLFWLYGHILMVHRYRNELDGVLWWLHFTEQGLQDGHNPLHTALLQMWQIPRYFEAIGDMAAAIDHNERGLDLCRRFADVKPVAWGLNHVAERYLAIGELAKAQAADEESLLLHRHLGMEGEVMEGTHILAQICYAQGRLTDAIELIETAVALAGRTGFHCARVLQRTLLGRLHLAQGHQAEAQAQFRIVLEMDDPEPWRMQWTVNALAGLEATYADPAAFHGYCLNVAGRRPELAKLGLQHAWLEPAVPDTGLPCDTFGDLAAQIAGGGREWIDPFGDCTWALDSGLVLRAANCRDLWANNFSAPRFLWPVEGDCALQVSCSIASTDRPAIGGLLLWQDRANYLRLTWGELGADQVAFSGALDNRNVVIGHGTLANAGCVWLRLERRGEQVAALCSADGRDWYRVGQLVFPADAPLMAGLHAIGRIDRTVYPGAYTEGAAVRFGA
jgi:DNA-binding SARP family transcriptional activator